MGDVSFLAELAPDFDRFEPRFRDVLRHVCPPVAKQRLPVVLVRFSHTLTVWVDVPFAEIETVYPPVHAMNDGVRELAGQGVHETVHEQMAV